MTMERERRSPGRPAGGSDAIVRAVFDATLAELARSGYARLSVEEVAAAAGMNKTSIYRRWPTKAELVLAAIDAHREHGPRYRETGDLRADLVTLLRGKAARLSTPQSRAIARALLSIEDDVELVASLRARRYSQPMTLMQHAVDRHVLPPRTDPAYVSEVLLAPVLQRLLVTNEPVTRAFVERIVDHVLA